MAGETREPGRRSARSAAWIVVVSVTILLIAVLVVSLAVGGGDDSSSDESGAGSEQAATSQAGAGGQDYTTFGEEASTADRDGAAGTVQAFLRARADDDFVKQCALMATSTKETLQGFGGGLVERHRPCPQLIETLLSQIQTKAVRQPGRIEVTGVRVEGDRGFVIYRDATGDTFAFSVIREDSAWKVGAINAYRVK